MLCDVEIEASSIRDTVTALERLGYTIAAKALNDSAATAYGHHYSAAPAKAWNSRHLEDLAFLTSLITNPTEVIAGLHEAGSNFDLAAVLDAEGHHAWAVAGEHAEDAHLMWDAPTAMCDRNGCRYLQFTAGARQEGGSAYRVGAPRASPLWRWC